MKKAMKAVAKLCYVFFFLVLFVNDSLCWFSFLRMPNTSLDTIGRQKWSLNVVLIFR